MQMPLLQSRFPVPSCIQLIQKSSLTSMGAPWNQPQERIFPWCTSHVQNEIRTNTQFMLGGTQDFLGITEHDLVEKLGFWWGFAQVCEWFPFPKLRWQLCKPTGENLPSNPNPGSLCCMQEELISPWCCPKVSCVLPFLPSYHCPPSISYLSHA